jgi:hypothetical protein
VTQRAQICADAAQHHGRYSSQTQQVTHVRVVFDVTSITPPWLISPSGLRNPGAWRFPAWITQQWHEGPPLFNNAGRRGACTTIPYFRRAQRVLSALVRGLATSTRAHAIPRRQIDSARSPRVLPDRGHATKAYILRCRFRRGVNFVCALSPAASHPAVESVCTQRRRADGRCSPRPCRVPACWRLQPRRLGRNGSVRYPIYSWDIYCRSRLEGSFAVPVPKGPGLFLRPNGPFLRV